MGMTIISSKTILDNANDFRKVTKKIMDDLDSKYKHYPVQFFVDGIFAIELYLKSIYFVNNRKYKRGTHKIDKLFKLISKDDQNYLISQIDNIEDLLKEYSNGFEKWRYSYENLFLHGKQEGIISILDLLYDYCNKNYYKQIKDIANNLPIV